MGPALNTTRRNAPSDTTGRPDGCIYPGCDRPVVPPHQAGGPPSAFCDREDHNALTAYQERKRLEAERGR
jgi:hypothetical protein